jgi:ATPase family associated with various cellular activities (AAA)
MYFQELFAEALREPFTAIAYHVSRHLAVSYSERAVLEGCDCDFNKLFDFARAGNCTLLPDDSTHNQVAVRWSSEQGIIEYPRNAWFEVEWEGETLDVVIMDWGYGCVPYHWILAGSRDLARRFYAAVCEFKPEIVDELMVFDGGAWTGSGKLLRQIGGSTFENLILPERLKGEIQGDVARFFASRESYERYGVPWKRGLLFVGPPGNGKTHAIKALINATGRPCLYIKTFESENWCEETGIRRVFERARSASPCLLVLEDLDSLVSAENRSFFLNELDGFAANVGILTIATTNHPGKLDPAILDRPSRFDRKYHFGLPARPERLAYIEQWDRTLEPEARLTSEGEIKAADRTEGFSFAYLKELFLSSLMSWVAAPDSKGMDVILLDQVASLREQMTSAPEETLDFPKLSE